MFTLDLEMAEEPEIKLPTFIGSQIKQENSRKTSASLTTLKPLTVWITKKPWNILQEIGIPDHLTCLLNNHVESIATIRAGTWNKWLVPNWERSTSRLYIVTLLT